METALDQGCGYGRLTGSGKARKAEPRHGTTVLVAAKGRQCRARQVARARQR